MTKKIIYLFGAGATQAVIKDMDPDKSLMTSDIQRLIEKHPKKFPRTRIEPTIWNQLVTEGYDIEHLISVLETQYNFSTSEKLRRYYQKALVELTKRVIKPNYPTLYTVLTDLYVNIFPKLESSDNLKEELLCYITLNYEDILERSIKKQLKCEIDYVIETTKPINSTNSINVIKLHGSFNWTNSRPIKVKRMTESGNVLWIPPGVEKRKDNYPFNFLWGKAMELLMNCDILRVVGCSLSRNDWGLIPILYTVQKFNDKKKIKIEIIDYPDTGKSIKKNYKYLNVENITEIVELKSSYQRKFQHATEDIWREEMASKFKDKNKTNAFQEWLDAKVEDLIENNIKLPPKGFAHRFYYKN